MTSFPTVPRQLEPESVPGNRPGRVRTGVRLLGPFLQRAVLLYVLDESSRMATGSFKDFDAVECLADCLSEGITEICVCSGANTGMAVAAHADTHGIRTHLFFPAQNLSKLDARHVLSGTCRLYAVEHAADTKELCKEFASRLDIPLVPRAEQRRRAARRRGRLMQELWHDKPGPDWFAQSVCAGFGPIGVYEFFTEQGGLGQDGRLPRFLAVQQATNSPLAAHLLESGCVTQASLGAATGTDIEPVMYDRYPETYGTFTAMETVMERSRGAVVTLNQAEYGEFVCEPPGHGMLARLQHLGLSRAFGYDNERDGKRPVQKAGVMAMAGVHKAIRNGIVQRDEIVLCSFSGGGANGRFIPVKERDTVWLTGSLEHSLAVAVTAAQTWRTGT